MKKNPADLIQLQAKGKENKEAPILCYFDFDTLDALIDLPVYVSNLPLILHTSASLLFSLQTWSWTEWQKFTKSPWYQQRQDWCLHILNVIAICLSVPCTWVSCKLLHIVLFFLY